MHETLPYTCPPEYQRLLTATTPCQRGVFIIRENTADKYAGNCSGQERETCLIFSHITPAGTERGALPAMRKHHLRPGAPLLLQKVGSPNMKKTGRTPLCPGSPRLSPQYLKDTGAEILQ